MERPESKQKVVVVGAGPVGSLAALYAAARGDDVEIYDLRGDIRDTTTTPLNFTKSINLALSERGINAMRQSGSPTILESVLAETITMHGRMIHGRNKAGQLYEAAQAYDVHGRFQRSVDRGGLNRRLLDELEKLPNVKLFFEHKLTGADFRKKLAWFERRKPPSAGDSTRPEEIEVPFSLMIGADGAHSATRYHMMKFTRMNYQQEYIDTLWCEFTIAPSKGNNFRISPNHLHIWPAGDFMFIALPSLDKTFTCTLFAPSELFAKVEEDPDREILPLFENHFPGVFPDLISPEDLKEQFKRNPHLPLINIKCTPHHFGSSVVIVGDAANAVVPFYGQGMNAGLESVHILFQYLDRFGVYSSHSDGKEVEKKRALALGAYTKFRTPDAHAIADLALRNYDEMKSHVVSPLYKLRKAVEETLDKYFPQLGWATQYSRVSFSNLRYSEVEALAAKQSRVFKAIFFLLLSLGLGGSGLWLSRLLVKKYGDASVALIRRGVQSSRFP